MAYTVLTMPACPRCDRTITNTTLRCPHCNLELKAHGHPGMDLHRAEGQTPLCATCAYDADNSCNFSKRPNALTCTLYQDTQAAPVPTRHEIYEIPLWRQSKWRKNSLRLALLLFIVLSLLFLSL